MNFRAIALLAAMVAPINFAAVIAFAQPPAQVWTEEGRAAVAAAPDAGPDASYPATDPAPDPIDDVQGFATEARDAFKAGKLAGVVLLLWGLARVAYRYRDKVALLNTPHRRALIVGATGVLAAASVSLMAGPFDWEALVGAVLAAVVLYMRPEPKAEIA